MYRTAVSSRLGMEFTCISHSTGLHCTIEWYWAYQMDLEGGVFEIVIIIWVAVIKPVP
jgi:hypothetical protein